MEINGHCDPKFEGVRKAFEANFESGLELGASASVTVGGECVVDLWAGDADPGGTPWAGDTIVNVYSTTKTMAAICVLMLADRGDVDLDAPVASYWPEFGANGKQDVLVRHVMAHTAGVSGFDPVVREPSELYDWDAVVSRLAAQAPWWTPGEGSGYHAITQGFLQGEIVRRVTGRSIGTFFREEVAEPLGADFHIGLDVAHDDRVGELIPPGEPPSRAGVEIDPISTRTMESCPIDGTEPRTRDWRGAEIPAAGGIGNARSVARVHSALACGGTVDGVRLMSEAGVARIFDEQSHGPDRVMVMPIRFGMGFGLVSPEWPLSPNPRTCYWGGWGGSLAVIDVDAGMSVAYVMNRMAADLMGDVRGGRIALSAYEALG